MLMTSVLLFIAMREIWNWPVGRGGRGRGLLHPDRRQLLRRQHGQGAAGRLGAAAARLDRLRRDVDLAPRRDARCRARVEAELTPLSTMVELLKAGKIARVPGSAVFFTRAKDQTPPVLAWHVRHNRALHEHVLALTMTVALRSRGSIAEERVTVKREGDHFWRAEVKLGFMEHPDIPEILAELQGERGAASTSTT